MLRTACWTSLVAVLVIVGAVPGEATDVDAWSLDAPAGSTWLVAELPLGPEDWTYDGKSWKMQLRARVTGGSPDGLVALDVVWVREGAPVFPFQPFVWREGMTASISMGTGAQPDASTRLFVVAAAETPAPGGLNVSASVGNASLEGPLATLPAMAAGEGAQLSVHWAVHDTHGSHEWTRNVDVQRTAGTRTGPLDQDAGWSAAVSHDAEVPSWHFSWAYLSTKNAVGRTEGEAWRGNDSSQFAGPVLPEVSTGSSIAVYGVAEGEASLELSTVTTTIAGLGTSYERVQAATIPFDPASVGIHDEGGFWHGSSGLGPMVSVGACRVPDSLWSDPVDECSVARFA